MVSECPDKEQLLLKIFPWYDLGSEWGLADSVGEQTNETSSPLEMA